MYGVRTAPLGLHAADRRWEGKPCRNPQVIRRALSLALLAQLAEDWPEKDGSPLLLLTHRSRWSNKMFPFFLLCYIRTTMLATWRHHPRCLGHSTRNIRLLWMMGQLHGCRAAGSHPRDGASCSHQGNSGAVRGHHTISCARTLAFL